MAEYDKASRYQVKQDPPGIFAWLWRRHRTPLVFHGWLDARRLALPVEGDLTCDLVPAFRLPDQRESAYALIVELKAQSERNTLIQLQGYIYRLCAERPADLAGIVPRVGGVVLNLSGPPQERLVAASFPGLPECDWQFGVFECNVREEDAAATLADILVGRTTRWLLPWIPLMRGGDDPAIMEGWKQAAATEPDERVRATLAAFALLFAELAKRGEAWKQALEGWNVQKSPLVEEWRNEARMEGLEEGRQVGLQEGRQEGRQEGHQKGRTEAVRESLLRVLRKRFGVVPQGLVDQIQAQNDSNRLQAALEQVLDIHDANEFQL